MVDALLWPCFRVLPKKYLGWVSGARPLSNLDMSSLLGKIPAALHPRVHSLEAPCKNAPIPSSQREECLLRSQDRNERINDIISGFLTEINNVAARISTKFALSHRHCLNLLFQDGVKMQQEHNNASSWTVYLSKKAATGISSLTILCPAFLIPPSM
jgi:hypothetical protein